MNLEKIKKEIQTIEPNFSDELLDLLYKYVLIKINEAIRKK
mgnify:CR=1 FL=1